MLRIHRRPQCSHPSGCTSRPSYGVPGTKATRCATHKEPGMDDVVNKTCARPGCKTQPVYGVPGARKRTHCAAHKEPGMEDVAYKTCAYPG